MSDRILHWSEITSHPHRLHFHHHPTIFSFTSSPNYHCRTSITSLPIAPSCLRPRSIIAFTAFICSCGNKNVYFAAKANQLTDNCCRCRCMIRVVGSCMIFPPLLKSRNVCFHPHASPITLTFISMTFLWVLQECSVPRLSAGLCCLSTVRCQSCVINL